MSENPLSNSKSNDNNILNRKRPNVLFPERSFWEEKPRLTKKQRKEYKEQLGDRAKPRDPSGWDTHPLGDDGIPASDMRYRVFDEMRSRGYEGRNAVARRFGVSGSFVTKWTKILKAAHELRAGVENVCRALSTRPPHTITSPVTDKVTEKVLWAKKI